MSHALAEAGGSFGRVSLMAIDRAVGAHAHPQCHALFKVAGDDSEFNVGGVRYPLATHTAVLVNAWQPHGYPFRPAMTGNALVLALYIEPQWLASMEARFGAAARRDFFCASCIRVPEELAALVGALAEELAAARCDAQRARELLREVMVELSLRFSNFRRLPRWARTAERAIGDHRIRKAMALITEQPATSLDLASVAREVALSRAHFFELFRSNVGISPGAYRSVVRMERAYRALLAGAGNVGEIGTTLGFGAHAHFTRFFRVNHGVSPDAYRRAARRLDA